MSHDEKFAGKALGFNTPGAVFAELVDGTLRVTRPTVYIFGAGIGGLTAAHELAERGFRVKVFEKQKLERTGGLAASQWHQSKRAMDLWTAIRTRINEEIRTGAKRGQTIPAHPEGKEISFVLPGEHGFRFFPAFYQHVIDTMRRTPSWDRRDLLAFERFPGDPMLKYNRANPTHTEAFRSFTSVAANLVPTHKTGIALADGFRVVVYDRRMPRSFQGTLLSLGMAIFGLGHEVRDVAQVFCKISQFLTSCSERRLSEYERVSFWKFMNGDNLSERSGRHLKRLIRLLAAMDATRADARTVLNVFTRMVQDHASRNDSEVDRVLNGPTSERWIAPWHRHLENRLGVEFYFDHELVRFIVKDGRIVEAKLKGKEVESLELDDKEGTYFLTDLPLQGLWKVLQDSPGLLVADEKETLQQPARSFPANNPDPPLKALGELVADKDAKPWMSGIQFYLSEPISLIPGHVNFADSAWGLSAVAQTQFWGEDMVSRYGYGVVRCILSVDIADFDTLGPTCKKSAKEVVEQAQAAKSKEERDRLSDELATEVWSQIADGLRQWEIFLPPPNDPKKQAAPQAPMPLPYIDHHIDDLLGICHCIEEHPLTKPPPPEYFVSPPNSWHKRPGPLPTYMRNEDGYRLRLGDTLAVAGVYAQTFTSLNTMESANESARHAVNAILRNAEKRLNKDDTNPRRSRFERCTIWAMEESEPADSVPWKELDRRLWERGAPHANEILGTENTLRQTFAVTNVDNRVKSPEELVALQREFFWWMTYHGMWFPPP